MMDRPQSVQKYYTYFTVLREYDSLVTDYYDLIHVSRYQYSKKFVQYTVQQQHHASMILLLARSNE
jgi:hypothetical protein